MNSSSSCGCILPFSDLNLTLSRGNIASDRDIVNLKLIRRSQRSEVHCMTSSSSLLYFFFDSQTALQFTCHLPLISCYPPPCLLVPAPPLLLVPSPSLPGPHPSLISNNDTGQCYSNKRPRDIKTATLQSPPTISYK